MVCFDTLRVKNLPKELTDAQKEDFLRHFGAISVKIITSKAKEKSIAFAKFDSLEIAKSVILRLHQTVVLNSRLCVEYAENDLLLGVRSNLRKIDEKGDGKQHFQSFISKLNAFNDAVGFHQPAPAHLKYAYPKANRGTINNIAHALATIPRFYTQVLHLMNKMNLPPPFAIDPRAAELAIRQPNTNIQQNLTNQQNPQNPVPPRAPAQIQSKTESDSESEIESDEDTAKNRDIIPQKRILPQKKPIKRPKFIKPSVQTQPGPGGKIDKPENVFEPIEASTASKTIELKVPETFEPKSPEKPAIISDEELAANQIPLKDLGVLPVFKNYHPGAPTSRLYIKNCAKTVVLKDLEYIFHKYKKESGADEENVFEIKLMQEGRMKGQAFVTLDSVETAQKALKETNGFMLKDKPLVVVFAKSAVKK